MLIGDPSDLDKQLTLDESAGGYAMRVCGPTLDSIARCLSALLDEQRKTRKLLEMVYEVEGLSDG